MISSVICKKLPIDFNFSLRGPTVLDAIEKDRGAGLIPFYVCSTLGTTSICSYDNLEEIGPICKRKTCNGILFNEFLIRSNLIIKVEKMTCGCI